MEGTAVNNVKLATFQDPGSTDPASDYTATVDWGDGTTTAGSVSGSAGSFTVTGSHTYSDELSSSYLVSVGETEANFTFGPISGPVTVTEGDFGTLIATTITPTEGTAFSGAVASFTDEGNPSQVASDFTSTIAWGAGTTTAGTVSGSTGGPFTISGTHTYADEGAFAVTASFSDDPPSALTNIPIFSTANVAEGDTITPGVPGFTFIPSEGSSFSFSSDPFTDTYTANTAADFTATIDWGDGTTTAGTVSGGSGSFTVGGIHLYA